MRHRPLERVVVVGAGVVGLAVARVLAQVNREVLILESEAGFGTSTSARSSEVIHAGIYYARGGLKARTCVRGRKLLYEYAQDRGIGVRRLGKLIVATTPDELPMLEKIRLQARANGVTDLQPLSAAALRSLEPALEVLGGLISPSTGIVDSRALMLALLGDAEARGAQVVYGAKVCGVRASGAGFQLRVENAEPSALECAALINCAGLGSVELARNIVGLAPCFVPRAYLCKGSYFGLRQLAPFRHLIYPVPDAQGLGVHLTFDLAGAARFGPDAEWVESADYRVDPDRAAAFERAVRRYWPGLPHGSLQPAYAGLRPKIVGSGDPPADFRVDGPRYHGVPGLVNLFGIESPGLTAALAIAEVVAALVAEG
jgi:L-2-hydroxyglutarate oxidase LhgO